MQRRQARIHKFKLGQTVNFTPNMANIDAKRGRYTVERLMPNDGVDYQYRIKSLEDKHERVVWESQLAD